MGRLTTDPIRFLCPPMVLLLAACGSGGTSAVPAEPLHLADLSTTLDLGDYDGDGDVDMVVGNFVGFTFTQSDTGFKSAAWIEVWENQGAGPGQEGH